MPPRLRYPEFAPEGMAHMRALEHYLNASTALPAVLLELVRLRVSLTNGCDFCIHHHANELRKHHEPESRIEALRDWQSSAAFTAREKAALAWADSVTQIQTRHAADVDYAAVETFFDEKDRVDLTLAIASINAWNRMSIAFRSEWDSARHKERTTPRSEEGNSEPAATEETIQSGQSDSPMQDALSDSGTKVSQD